MIKKTSGRQSKTINFALIFAMVSAVQIALPQVRDSIPAEYYGWIGMGVSVVIAYLRFRTSEPLNVRRD